MAQETPLKKMEVATKTIGDNERNFAAVEYVCLPQDCFAFLAAEGATE